MKKFPSNWTSNSNSQTKIVILITKNSNRNSGISNLKNQDFKVAHYGEGGFVIWEELVLLDPNHKLSLVNGIRITNSNPGGWSKNAFKYKFKSKILGFEFEFDSQVIHVLHNSVYIFVYIDSTL